MGDDEGAGEEAVITALEKKRGRDANREAHRMQATDTDHRSQLSM